MVTVAWAGMKIFRHGSFPSLCLRNGFYAQLWVMRKSQSLKGLITVSQAEEMARIKAWIWTKRHSGISTN